MSKIDDGGPAFPWHQSLGNQDNLGMSLRDWFAGMALTGLTNPAVIKVVGADTVTQAAYELADAMIAERKAKS